MAAARGLPIPAPDEVPSEESTLPAPAADTIPIISEPGLNSLTLPISSRSQSFNSDSSAHPSLAQPNFSFPTSSMASTGLIRGRAQTLAALDSKNMPPVELTPREMHLPRDPYVNGQPIEAYLYKDAIECPICFLYYPPYLNRTRCCDQAICSECFVQIKRPEPHPPEHADATAAPRTTTEDPIPAELDTDTALVAEPAACPFCVQPEFGITFEAPPFRRGLTYVNQASSHPFADVASAMSSSSSLGSTSAHPTGDRRRAASLSASAPTVITTDRIRPDWATKLASARAHAARRSAAATALHTAAYLMSNRNGSPDSRPFGGLGRRGILRRGIGGDSPSGGANSAQLNMLALMSERYAAPTGSRPESASLGETSPTMVGPPRGSSRRSRMDDLEDMMMMEAIRLSLASEEERRKCEEKEAKKEAKKKSKEEKKDAKAARKAGMYSPSSNQSSNTLDSLQSGTLADSGKGKGIQRELPGKLSDTDMAPSIKLAPPDSPQLHLEKSRAQLMPNDAMPILPYGNSNGYKPSHLRTLSNASSSASSVAESNPGSQRLGGSSSSFEPSPSASGINIPRAGLPDSFAPATPPVGGAGIESMFNFQSLAAMIEKDGTKGGTILRTEPVASRSSDDGGESSGGGIAELGYQANDETEPSQALQLASDGQRDELDRDADVALTGVPPDATEGAKIDLEHDAARVMTLEKTTREMGSVKPDLRSHEITLESGR